MSLGPAAPHRLRARPTGTAARGPAFGNDRSAPLRTVPDASPPEDNLVMQSRRPLLATAAALAAFALVTPATSWAQTAEIEIVGVVGDTTVEPFCNLFPVFANEFENADFTPETSGPNGGRVDILALADADGRQQAFRVRLGAGLECNVGAQATITSSNDGLLNRDAAGNYVDYTAQIEIADVAADSFTTNRGAAPGANSASITFVGSAGLDVIVASLPEDDLLEDPMVAGTYFDFLTLDIQPQ